jgi:phenylalanyl-tRNA synthetase beta chain
LRHAEVLAALPASVPHLESTSLNSIYRGQGVPENHKALHYTFTYRHSDRALTDDEVSASHAKVVGALSGIPGLTIK